MEPAVSWPCSLREMRFRAGWHTNTLKNVSRRSTEGDVTVMGESSSFSKSFTWLFLSSRIVVRSRHVRCKHTSLKSFWALKGWGVACFPQTVSAEDNLSRNSYEDQTAMTFHSAKKALIVSSSALSQVTTSNWSLFTVCWKDFFRPLKQVFCQAVWFHKESLYPPNLSVAKVLVEKTGSMCFSTF